VLSPSCVQRPDNSRVSLPPPPKIESLPAASNDGVVSKRAVENVIVTAAVDEVLTDRSRPARPAGRGH